MTPFSPLDSAVLQQQFTGLSAAVDEETMRAAFQAALFDPASTRFTIERCDLDQATVISQTGCNFRYMLQIRDSESHDTHEALVSGDLFVSQQAAEQAHAKLRALSGNTLGQRPEFRPFAAPVALIELLRMVVRVFPIDADMPTLLATTDNQYMLAVLRDVLPQAAEHRHTLDACRTELVDYGRQYRCTLRYRLTGHADDQSSTDQTVVYGKLTADGSGRLAAPVSAALRSHAARASGLQVRIPQVLTWLPDLKLSLLEAIPGEALIGAALKARVKNSGHIGQLSLEEMLDHAAAIAALLHTSALELGPSRTLVGELARLNQRVSEMRHVAPELSTQLTQCLQQLEPYALTTTALKLSHGDFTSGQLLFDGGASGLIDFDSICQAEPALDLAQFLTYVQLTGRKTKSVASAAEGKLLDELASRVLTCYSDTVGYGAADTQRLQQRVAVYKVVSLTRRAVQSWHKFKPKRVIQALNFLEEAVQQLP